MADTLAEIYRDTLVESDFNSSGEATIVTTDSSTSHVIKSVQVVEGNSNVPVAGNIDVNGFNVGALTGNSSGTEIIAPSSTVKVKTDKFPLAYTDKGFTKHYSSTEYYSFVDASINGFTPSNLVGLESSNNTNIPANVSSTLNQSYDKYHFAPFIGPNNYIYGYEQNASSGTTRAFVFDSSGTQLYSRTTNYTPHWFYGERYSYFYQQSYPSGIHRLDTWTATSSHFASAGYGSPGASPLMMGVKDKYLIFGVNRDTNPQYYSFIDGSSDEVSSQTADNTFGMGFSNPYNLVETSTDYKIVIPNGEGQFFYYSWNKGDNLHGQSYSTLNLSGSAERMSNQSANMPSVGSKLYYTNEQLKIAYVEFEESTPTAGNVISNAISSSYNSSNRSITYLESEPDSTAIAARNYGTAPSLGLRITGVTST